MRMRSELLCFLIFVIAVTCDDSCEPWPAELPSLKHCCEFPLAGVSEEEMLCNTKCYDHLKDHAKLRECIEECFIKNTKLLKEDKTIDKEEVKKSNSILRIDLVKLYESDIDLALEKCEYSSTGKISFDLAKYFHCIRGSLIQKCKSFRRHFPGCDLVEEHFRKCNKIEPNCSEWTEDYSSNCCDTPELVKPETAKQCVEKCKKSEYFNSLLRKCFLDCVINETKLIVDGKFNSEAAKSLLFENANKTAEWEKPIANVIEMCEKKLQGSPHRSDTPLNIIHFVIACTENRLGLQCPTFLENPFCRKLKEFVEKCSEPKMQSQFSCWMSDVIGCSRYY